MAKTVVGIFEYESDAQDAQNYLLANGYGDGLVDIKIASYKSQPEKTDSVDTEENLLEKISHFFKHLFDSDAEETQRYAEAGRRGTIVTVHADSADEADRAAAILDSYGAVDVNHSKVHLSSAEKYEDPILNPPSVSETGVRPSRSVIFERQVQENIRLRQQRAPADQINIDGLVTGTSVDTFDKGTIPVKENADVSGIDNAADQVTLNHTLAERDELINEIVRKA